MYCFIKDFKTFETVNKMDLLSMRLADGEPGTVMVNRQHNEVYNEAWLVINGEVFYVSGCQPDDRRLELIVEHPLNAFTRPILRGSETTYGAMLKNGLEANYARGGGDSFYAMPYLVVDANASKYPADINVDDFGYYILSDAITQARANGVSVDFILDGARSERLKCVIRDNVLQTQNIVFGDGHHVLSAESYTDNVTSKATVIKPSSTTHYYLSADHRLSTTPPENRLPGKWKVYGEYSDEIDGESVARGAFSGNTDSHRIEFTSDKVYTLNQPVRLRLNGSIYDTTISAIVRTGEDFTLYKCGSLAIRLTERIRDLEQNKR